MTEFPQKSLEPPQKVETGVPLHQAGWTLAEGWGIFIASQVLLMIVSVFLPSQQLDWYSCQLMFGLVIAQCVLAGVWLTFGPGWLIARFAGVPLWVLCAVGMGGVIDRPGEAFVVMFICGAMTTLTIAAVMAVARWSTKVRLVHLSDLEPAKPFQYQLKHLLILMAIVSVMLAIGRSFTLLMFDNWILKMVVAFLLASLSWTIGSVPLVFVVFAAREKHRLWLSIAGASVFAGVCISGGNWLILLVGNQPHEGLVSPLAVVGVIGYLVALLGFLWQRRIGYRLERR